MTLPDYAAVLEGLATRPVPVLGAEAAAAHTRRGYGFPCPEELGAVWSAIDRWRDAGSPEREASQRSTGTYVALVSALTRYQLAVERELGLRS